MTRTALAIIFAVALSTPAGAQTVLAPNDPDNPFKRPPAVAQQGAGGLGAGATKCAQVTAEMDNQIQNIAYSWAEGFMVAVNLCTGASIQKYRNLAALSRDAQERFIRNFCLRHPNEDYQNAVWALLNTLPIMAHTP